MISTKIGRNQVLLFNDNGAFRWDLIEKIHQQTLTVCHLFITKFYLTFLGYSIIHGIDYFLWFAERLAYKMVSEEKSISYNEDVVNESEIFISKLLVLYIYTWMKMAIITFNIFCRIIGIQMYSPNYLILKIVKYREYIKQLKMVHDVTKHNIKESSSTTTTTTTTVVALPSPVIQDEFQSVEDDSSSQLDYTQHLIYDELDESNVSDKTFSVGAEEEEEEEEEETELEDETETEYEGASAIDTDNESLNDSFNTFASDPHLNDSVEKCNGIDYLNENENIEQYKYGGFISKVQSNVVVNTFNMINEFMQSERVDSEPVMQNRLNGSLTQTLSERAPLTEHHDEFDNGGDDFDKLQCDEN